MLRKISFGLVIILFLCISSIMAQDDKNKLEIITTLFPIYDFARHIGQDKTNVSLLLPPGIEAHTFEPTPADIVRINKADVFIYTGKYMEPWVEDILKGASNKNLTVVDASEGIEVMVEDNHKPDEDSEKDKHRQHNGGDPHIWLDFGNAQLMVDNIAAVLAQKDTANSEFYLHNAKEYNSKLANIDEQFKSALSECKHKTLICGGHFAFGYLARRYGLEHISPYQGFSPNAEPAPKSIAQLIDTLRQTGIKCIYYEELLDPKVARTISQETGAEILLLHGAHNISKDELEQGVTFLEIMEENLEKLKIGLECSPR